MSNAILDDLEIDHKDMLSDPKAFMSRVYEKADELKEVLRTDTSMKAMESRFRDNMQFAPPEIGSTIESIYKLADDAPLDTLLDTIAQVRKLVQDLETMFTDRVIYAAADNNQTIADKKTAHEQYTRLRDATNSYINALKVLKFGDDFAFKPLPAMPGNYGSSVSNLIRYVFEYKGEQYRNHRYICRQLGIPVGTLMDCLEYIQAHPESGVVVKMVK